ncbi:MULTISPECIES: beta-ketoacyl synthase [unclassified Streptomyces]|uniref:beta-ketoacyl-[acyl-carrier-protein] synthase family protein n=1 Tax=unclassified Streptomyces TaxID=2593676 RepID=UPI00278BD379|nr:MULTISPECIES: beta-ketoacyl-[acyl-carrier-protein] synthase family protein [unclassified Streptomyces]
MTQECVVTGLGAVTPLGVGADVLHERAVAGESGVLDGIGYCDAFDAADALPHRLVRRTDRAAQLAVAAADEALARAGWAAGDLPYPADRVACVIGCGLGGTASHAAELGVLEAKSADAVSPLLMPRMMANAAAAQLAMRYGLTGESLCVTSACTSGAQAIGAALRLLASGAVDAVVTGGTEASTSPVVRATFRNARALSESGRSVPFDRDRDGFLLGEGAGVLVLERSDAARRRGAPHYGSVLGYGASSDAHHVTAPDPEGTAAAQAVTRALASAGIGADALAYINAHGTGTPLNDAAEAVALRRALGEPLAAVPLSSSKSALGHTLGAAGAVEAVVALQALRHGVAPPTRGLRTPDERLGPLDHIVEARKLPGEGRRRVALSTSFGFGGHNAALVLGAAPDDSRAAA